MYIKKIFDVDFLSKFLLCAMVFVVPIFFYPSNLHFFINLKLGIFFGVIIIGTIFWSISMLKSNEFYIPKNLIVLSIFLVLLTSFFSAIFSENAFISIFGTELSLASFTGIFLLFLFSFVISTFFKEEKSSVVLLITVYSSLVLTQILSILYLFIDNPHFNFFVSNSVNTIGKWSDLGVISSLVIILSILIIEMYDKNNLKIFARIGLIISIFMAVIISENIVWISLGIISVLYFIFKIFLFRKENNLSTNRGVSYITISIILISFFMILAGGLISSFTDNWLKINFSEAKPSMTSTLQMTKGAIQQDPFFGVGINRFERAWQQNKPESINLTNYWGNDFYSGYSYLTSVPAQSGLLGIVAWLFFIVLLITSSIKLMIKRTEIERKDLNMISSISVLFFVVILLLHNPSVSVLIVFFVFLGMFFATLTRNNLYFSQKIKLEENPKTVFFYIFSIVFLMILMIYVGYMSARQFASTLFLENASYYLNAGNKEMGEKYLANSVDVFRSDKNLRIISEYNQILINQLLADGDMNKQSSVDSFRELLSNAIDSSTAAIGFDSQNYINYISLAKIYEKLIPLNIEGSYEEAIKIYEKAMSFNPKNPGIYVDLARTAFAADKKDVARGFIDKALEMKPNFVNAIFLLSQIQISEGNTEEAIKSLEMSINVEPNNYNLYFQLGLLRYSQDNFEGAITSFEKAIILNPTFANAKYFLGLSYDKTGKSSDAISQFEDLKLWNADNQEIQKILDNLKSGASALNGINKVPEEEEELPVKETEDVE